MAQLFGRLANRIGVFSGSYISFITAIAVVIVWAVSGPFFGFSDTWQLVINTGTTVVTFLMVFLIQNTQNRDTMAIHLKLDELIRAMSSADNSLIRAEEETVEELGELKVKYQSLVDETEDLVRAIDQPTEESGEAPADGPSGDRIAS